tara:strand:- start:55 stop:1956 length:1902 start_codon:yes stop_codon:yes gene_type:complete
MTGFFDRTYPPSGRVLLDGGLDTKFAKTIIPENESPDCANVLFENGAAGTRGGSTALAGTSFGSHIGDGIYVRHDNDGSETMCVWGGGDMYDFQSTTFVTIGSAQSVFVSGSRIGATEYENYLFVGQSGVTNPYKWDGSTFSRHGVPIPQSAPTAVINSAGTLTGDYSWKVTYVNTNVVEGDVGSATATYAATADRYVITIPTAPASFGVNARKIYRTETSGITYKLVTTISDNSTTSYTDNSSDSELGSDAPTDNGVPPQYSFIKEHQNRLFCNDVNNGNFLWYSDLANPYVFKATNFNRIGDNSGDLLRNIEVFDNGIIAFGQRHTYIVYMPSTDASTWVVVQARTTMGSKSPYGSVEFENRVMFPATQAGQFVGFATLQGDTIEPSATFLTVSVAGSELQSDVIEPNMFDIQQSFLGNISAISFKNRLYITVTSGDGETLNNKIYVYDYSISNLAKKKRGAWVPYTGLSPTQFAIYDGKLYFIESTATGLVKQLETASYNDNTAAIDSYYETKEFSGLKGEEDLQKDYRTLQLLFDKPGDYFMNLRTKVDSDLGEGNNQIIDLDPGGSIWGTMTWGNDVWGGGTAQEDKRIFLGSTRGKRIAFKFTNQNTVDQRFRVHGFRFSYNIKGKR